MSEIVNSADPGFVRVERENGVFFRVEAYNEHGVVTVGYHDWDHDEWGILMTATLFTYKGELTSVVTCQGTPNIVDRWEV